MLRRLGKPGGFARGARGQAALETAIVLPLMVFMLLGVIQLTLIQQARILTENAAYNAARAGIVFNADRGKMTNAAMISLVPALPIIKKGDFLGSLLQFAKWGLIAKGTQYMDEGIDQLQALLSQINVNFTGIPSVSLVRVDTINPTKAAFEKIAQKFPDYGTRSEIDFDDTTDDADLRDANRLTIRTRFLYPMKIPFANYIIHKAFMAQSAGVLLSGPIFSRRLPNQQWNTNSAADMTIQSRLPGSDPVQWIFGDKDLTILRVLWELGKQGIYMVPLRATAAMRMQSNIFKDNLQ